MYNSLHYLTFMKRIVSMDNFGLFFFFWYNAHIARHTHQTSTSMIFTCLFLGIKNIRTHLIFWTHQLKISAEKLSAGTSTGLSAGLGHQGVSFSAMKSQDILENFQRAHLAGFVQFSRVSCGSHRAGRRLVEHVCTPLG